MDKPRPPQTFDEEAVAQVRERVRSQKRSGRPARTYEQLVAELKERIKRTSNPEDRADLERVLLESEAREARNAELRTELAKLARRWDRSTSPLIAGLWLVGLSAVVIVGIILAKHYF